MCYVIGFSMVAFILVFIAFRIPTNFLCGMTNICPMQIAPDVLCGREFMKPKKAKLNLLNAYWFSAVNNLG